MNIAEVIVKSLADYGVTEFWGVVGDALNPVVDALRTEDRVEWMGVRHEEAGAFAASAQAQLTGRLAVCMGTVGPGAIHLLNGLYDAKKSHAPVLAILGQVPTEEIGTSFFQEVNNDVLFADVAEFAATVTSANQMPHLLEAAVNAAIARQGVAVLSLPGDISGLSLPHGTKMPTFTPPAPPTAPSAQSLQQAAHVLNDAKKVTILAGRGARSSRVEVLQLAEKLQAPMVLTLKGKPDLERDNPYEVGQSGLIGNPAAASAFDDCDVLLMLGTDFPYREWYPSGKTVIQIDREPAHIGRRTNVDLPLVGSVGPAVSALLPLLSGGKDSAHLKHATDEYANWLESQHKLADPAFDESVLGKARALVDNREEKVRPEAVAQALDKVCGDDTVFTSDTGMSTVWLSRLLPMRGNRELVGSYNLGSMANAMPMALGAQALDRSRQVVALCGDGGLMMLIGDLRTAVTYQLPLTCVVFNNSRLGMVKLEQEQVGLPEYGVDLDNPNFADVAAAMGLRSRRVEDPAELEAVLREAVSSREPWVVDVVTNPDEVSVPGKVKPAQAWGFAKAKVTELFSDKGPTGGGN